MKVLVERIVLVVTGAIVGSMTTMLLLNDRVDQTLQSDFGRWSSSLLILLIALIAIEWVVMRMWKQS
ncbi:MAG TPA: hypothetical protein VFY95_07010 [Sphingomicrobium sp.]